MTAYPTLIAADIGNVNTKFRRQGGAWEIEPSLVRMLSGRTGYSFTNDTPVRPLVYRSGPAGIEPHTPYLVGRDAQRAGITDVAVIGSAELRVHSPAYLLLHLYAIIASLPAGVTSAQIAFAGGLPVEDDGNPQVRETLRQRLTGKAEKSSPPIPHVLAWGDHEYTLTIARTSFIPQPLALCADAKRYRRGRDAPVHSRWAHLYERHHAAPALCAGHWRRHHRLYRAQGSGACARHRGRRPPGRAERCRDGAGTHPAPLPQPAPAGRWPGAGPPPPG